MSDRKDHLDGRAVVLLVACSLLWGLNQVAVKLALPEVPALVQAAIRSLGGAVLVVLWSRARGIALFGADGSLRAGLAAGALFAAEFACIFIGLQYTTASRMIVFIYVAPFVVAAGMPFIARSERLSTAQWSGLAVAFCGVALAFSESLTRPAAGASQWVGDALGVLAALAWAATTLVIRASPLGSAPPEKTLAYQLAVSGVLLLAGSALHQDAWRVRAWSAGAWASLAYQTVVVVSVSYLVWFWLVRHYPATRLSAFTLLTPVAGLLMGVTLLHEPLTPQLLLALVGVVAGIALVNRRAR